MSSRPIFRSEAHIRNDLPAFVPFGYVVSKTGIAGSEVTNICEQPPRRIMTRAQQKAYNTEGAKFMRLSATERRDKIAEIVPWRGN